MGKINEISSNQIVTNDLSINNIVDIISDVHLLRVNLDNWVVQTVGEEQKSSCILTVWNKNCNDSSKLLPMVDDLIEYCNKHGVDIEVF